MLRGTGYVGLFAFLCGVCTPLPAQEMAAEVRSLTLKGTCDGSAAVWIDGDSFVDANDEDPVLRIYSATDGRLLPEMSLDLSTTLGVGTEDEPDIEGGARIGDRIYWITSHALDGDGVIRPERHRLFATEVTRIGGKPRLAPVGRTYFGLLKAIAKAAKDMSDLALLDLPAKAKVAPETAGGFNIEALAAGPDQSLFIGFRSPIQAAGENLGKALVLPLLNPAVVLEVRSPAKPKFGQPIFLDLGGLGIRDMTSSGDGYLLLAGPVDGSKSAEFALYRWSGENKIAPSKLDVSFAGLRPEALSSSGSRLLILSDDGDEKPTGTEKCKDLKVEERRFAGRLMPLPK
jgi:hypothetical protein